MSRQIPLLHLKLATILAYAFSDGLIVNDLHMMIDFIVPSKRPFTQFIVQCLLL